MNKKDKKDQKIDYINNFIFNHDLYQRYKKFSENMNDIKEMI